MLYIKFPTSTKFMFFNPSGKMDARYGFTSKLDKIGSELDVSIKNGTYVESISDPVDIYHPKYGDISVIKIRADVSDDYHTIIEEFWVPVKYIISSEKLSTIK